MSDPASALRAAALEALGPMADPRARDALVHGLVSVSEGVSRWESSHGTTHGDRAVLALDAARLGTLRATPALVDLLRSAFARAVARRPGRSLDDLTLAWSRSAPLGDPGGDAGYRGATPQEPPAPGEALVAYLEAAGEPHLAMAAQGATLVPGPPWRMALVTEGQRRVKRSDRAKLAAWAAELLGEVVVVA